MKQKIKRYGNAQNNVRVKKVFKNRFFLCWVAGVRVMSDDGIITLTKPCGKGGTPGLTEYEAVMLATTKVLDFLASRPYDTFSFEQAEKVFTEIRDKIKYKK